MEQSYTLVLLAAGLGSRFGGIKQLEPVGPAGEILMDYSVHDAIEAGFRHVVFIIRKEIEADFQRIMDRRLAAYCKEKGVSVRYAYQETEDLPGGFACPAGRTKPWGTVHALLACKDVVTTPFVVLNADDYYGKQGFRVVLDWLRQLPCGSEGAYCMAGFLAGHTLSDHGGVTRGICQTDAAGYLTGVQETKSIVKTPGGAEGQWEGRTVQVPMDAYVSMNLWGFTPDIFHWLEESMCRFLAQHGTELTSELVLPVLVDELLKTGRATVQVLPTSDSWLGITYRDDLPAVRAAFLALMQRGVYGPQLLND